MTARLTIEKVTKVFSDHPEQALPLLAAGASKDRVHSELGAVVALNGISLSVPAGAIYMIMGLSGSGKSTLARCVNRLIEPTAGRILLDGEDVLAASPQRLRELRRTRMSMVFQHFALLPHKSVVENVAFGLKLRGTPAAERRRKAEEVLAIVGLEQWAGYRPSSLSGGMRQRVGLARALATDADLMIMDEAFSALDPLIRSEMQDELLALQKLLHKTILFITHDFQEALKLGTRIAILSDGAVVREGTPQEIVLDPRSDYVAAFTRDVDRARLFDAASVMIPAAPIVVADGTPCGAGRGTRLRGGPRWPLPRGPRGSPQRQAHRGRARVERRGCARGHRRRRAPHWLHSRRRCAGAHRRAVANASGGEVSMFKADDLPRVPIDDWIQFGVEWTALHLRPVFLLIKWPVETVLRFIDSTLQSVPFPIFVVLFALLAWRLASRGIAAFSAFSLIAIAFMGLWKPAITTLSLITTAIVFCVLIGVPIGILCARSNATWRVVRPILDIMQTTPSFVYLVPVVMFFGVGTVPGEIAVVTAAAPALIRFTNLGIRLVDKETIEAGLAFGATERQLLWEIQLPLALPTILGGLNQTVLTAMVMSVIIAMIGAEGLGLVVLQGIGRLDVGRAAIGGIAIVLLAMTLDRITQALANPEQKTRGQLMQAVSRFFLGSRRHEVGQPVLENK